MREVALAGYDLAARIDHVFGQLAFIDERPVRSRRDRPRGGQAEDPGWGLGVGCRVLVAHHLDDRGWCVIFIRPAVH